MKLLISLLTTLIWALPLLPPAFASPGAHGPNGEHLDAPAAATGDGDVPHLEASTELFELVGRLSGGELSILIDRYDTNEPVLDGRLEVQYRQLKAQATFHRDIGDYAVDDPAMLAALSKPGRHALLFTLVAGDESDLIEGTLEAPQPVAPPRHAGLRWQPWAAGLAAVALIAAALLVRRRVSQPVRK